MTREPRKTYHHGNLPHALIEEGATLVSEKGLDGFSMRAVARCAGVAAAAPSHHFGSARGLLTAIATEGFSRLSQRLAVAAKTAAGPEETVVAMCLAYIELCKQEPGYSAIMFRLDLLDERDPSFQKHAVHAFDLFSDAVTRAASRDVEAAGPGQAAKLLWAAMHGLQALAMINTDEAEALVRFAVRTLLDGMRSS